MNASSDEEHQSLFFARQQAQLCLTVAVSVLEISHRCGEVLRIGYNFRRDTAFLNETTDVHVLVEIGTNTDTYNG